MKAFGLKKIKLLPVIFIVALALVSIMPTTAFAAPGDITIEYRYLEGETVDVPTTVTQLNREYRLVGQTPSVLESTLPVTRTYTYEIDGALSDEDLKQIASMPGLTVEPRQEQLEREAEKTVKLNSLRSNDVSKLPAGQAPQTIPADTGTGTLRRSGIEFSVTGWDARGLPNEYEASVKYRGIEIYLGDVYYVAESTYQTTVSEDDVDQFVIVATYRPVDQPVPAQAPAAPEAPVAAGVTTPEEPAPAPEPEQEPAPQEPGTVVEIPAEEVPLAPGLQETESTETIEDTETPLASSTEPDSSSATYAWLWVILGIAAVLIVGLLIFRFIRKRKAEDADM